VHSGDFGDGARHDFLFQKSLILDWLVIAKRGKTWAVARVGVPLIGEFWISCRLRVSGVLREVTNYSKLSTRVLNSWYLRRKFLVGAQREPASMTIYDPRVWEHLYSIVGMKLAKCAAKN